MAEEEQELEALAESLDKTCTRYKTDIKAEKTKLMTNIANDIQRETRTVRKSDYTPALVIPKHMAGILDKNVERKKNTGKNK